MWYLEIVNHSELLYTVEFPNNEYVGDTASVRCRESSAYRRSVHLVIKIPNMHHLSAVLHVLVKLNSYGSFFASLIIIHYADKI